MTDCTCVQVTYTVTLRTGEHQDVTGTVWVAGSVADELMSTSDGKAWVNLRQALRYTERLRGRYFDRWDKAAIRHVRRLQEGGE